MDVMGNLSTESNAQTSSATQQLYDMFAKSSTSSKVAVILGGIALAMVVFKYLVFMGAKPAMSSRKAQQAKAMREAYRSMNKQSSLANSKKTRVSIPPRSLVWDTELTCSPEEQRRKGINGDKPGKFTNEIYLSTYAEFHSYGCIP